MDTATEEVTLEELHQLAMDGRLLDLHTALPCAVTAYDATTQTVSVIIAINRMVPDGADGSMSEPLPKLADVPVSYPRSKQFAITFPLVAGDTGMLVFCERPIGAWRAAGTQGDPGDLGMHTLDGAVFVPGLYPDKFPALTASSANMVIGSDTNGPSRMEITPSSGGHLGAGATKGIVRTGDKTAADTSMAAWIGAAQTLLQALAIATGGVAPVAPTDFGANTGGSANWKAVD